MALRCGAPARRRPSAAARGRLGGARAAGALPAAAAAPPLERLATSVAAAHADAERATVVVRFADGAQYAFHALWLRDACRSEEFVKTAAGERVLAKTLAASVADLSSLGAASAEPAEDGAALHCGWTDGESGALSGAMLRAYAPVVAEEVAPPSERHAQKTRYDSSWLSSFTGAPDAPAPETESMALWTASDGPNEVPTLSWDRVLTPEGNLELYETLLRDFGACRVYGAPKPGVAALHEFADYACNGLQKDPSREESNWLIVRKDAAASVSYNPATRLANHTDQSLPNHGIPGIFLMMHYAKGYGANTIVDGFAAAEALRASDREAFRLLSIYGNDQERDLLKSRQDAAQGHTASLYLSSVQPIIQLDGAGRIRRVQFNEVFRTPASVPFADFKAWYAAYHTFARMLESPEFERELPMSEGDLLIVNNWRVLHGRAGAVDGSPTGKQSPDRTLVGGTVTRENAFSRARQLVQLVKGVELYGPLVLPAEP